MIIIKILNMNKGEQQTMGRNLRTIIKKIFAIAMVLIMGFAAVGCGDSTTDSSNNDSASNASQSQSGSQGVTLEDIIKQNASKALYDRLMDLYGDQYNVSATKYSIASIEESTYSYYVRGQFYMYDKYGEAVSKYFPGTFFIVTDKNGNVGSDYRSVSIEMG